MPASQTVEGQALDIQGHVRNRLHQFLATHYSQNGSPRPVELLDFAWKDASHRGGSSIKALHDRLDCLSTLVLEANLVQDALPFQFAWWGPLQEGYQYQYLGEFDWRTLLKESARERARQWRTTRAELVRAGHAGDDAEADRLFGGENPANLRTLELEERLGAMPGIHLPPYTFAAEDFTSLYRHLTTWYCLSTALVADLHHFRYNDTLPRLPELLPDLLAGTRFPQSAMVELLLRAYEPLASERPDRARDLHQVLTGLPESPFGRSLLPRLVTIAEAQAQAARRAQLLAPQDLHGQSTAFVQQRQRETAEALGRPVTFLHRLKDGSKGPVMQVIPAGRFLMGSPASEPERADDEGTQHPVTLAHPFAIGRAAVTFAEYDAFCVATARAQPGDPGWGRDQRPVINVSWDDAVAYCDWLRTQTGHPYRLPSEAEWEYASRAGTTTPFWWGGGINPSLANYDGNYTYANGPKGEYRQRTLPVDAFQLNPFGLYQVHGNVWEWCQDRWHGSYAGAPADGAPGKRVERGPACCAAAPGTSPRGGAAPPTAAAPSPTPASSTLGFGCVVVPPSISWTRRR